MYKTPNGMFLKPCPKCGHPKPAIDFWIGCSYDQAFIVCMDDDCDFSIFMDTSGGHYTVGSHNRSNNMYPVLAMAWNHLDRTNMPVTIT